MAIVGHDVILPCYMQPAVGTLTVEWWKWDLRILVWHFGMENVSEKHPSYDGRISLFIDQLKLGDLSLKLSNVTTSDEGTFRCLISTKGTISVIQLVVGKWISVFLVHAFVCLFTCNHFEMHGQIDGGC